MNENTSINDTSNHTINSTDSNQTTGSNHTAGSNHTTGSINKYNPIDNYDINSHTHNTRRKRSNTLDISSLSTLNRRKKLADKLNSLEEDDENLTFHEKLEKLRLNSKIQNKNKDKNKNKNKIKFNKNHLAKKLDDYYSNKINDRDDEEEDILSDIILNREELLSSPKIDENYENENNEKDTNDSDQEKLKILKVNKYYIKSNYQNLLNTSFWSIDQLYVKPGDSDFIIWFLASSYMPLLAGCIGPLSNLLSIGALVSSWKTSKENPLEWESDESWVYTVNSISVFFGLASNFSLLLNFRKVLRYRFTQAVSIWGWLLACITLLSLVIAYKFEFERKNRSDYYSYGPGYWFACFTVLFYFTNFIILLINELGFILHKYPPIFNISSIQQSLMSQCIVFVIWLLWGSALFARLMNLTFNQSLYFAVVTVLTVGLGDIVPNTPNQRAAVLVWCIFGLVIFGLIISSIRELMISSGASTMLWHRVQKRRKLGYDKFKKSIDSLNSNSNNNQITNNPNNQINQDGMIKPILNRSTNTNKNITFNEPFFRNKGSSDIINTNNNNTTTTTFTNNNNNKNNLHNTPFHHDHKHLLHNHREELNFTDSNKFQKNINLFSKKAFFKMRKLERREFTKQRISSTVVIVFVWLSFWLVGSLIFAVTENWSYGTACYFSFLTLVTIGYGVPSPVGNGQVFFVIWSISAVPVMTIFISNVADVIFAGIKSSTKLSITDKFENFVNKINPYCYNLFNFLSYILQKNEVDPREFKYLEDNYSNDDSTTSSSINSKPSFSRSNTNISTLSQSRGFKTRNNSTISINGSSNNTNTNSNSSAVNKKIRKNRIVSKDKIKKLSNRKIFTRLFLVDQDIEHLNSKYINDKKLKLGEPFKCNYTYHDINDDDNNTAIGSDMISNIGSNIASTNTIDPGRNDGISIVHTELPLPQPLYLSNTPDVISEGESPKNVNTLVSPQQPALPPPTRAPVPSNPLNFNTFDNFDQSQNGNGNASANANSNSSMITLDSNRSKHKNFFIKCFQFIINFGDHGDDERDYPCMSDFDKDKYRNYDRNGNGGPQNKYYDEKSYNDDEDDDEDDDDDDYDEYDDEYGNGDYDDEKAAIENDAEVLDFIDKNSNQQGSVSLTYTKNFEILRNLMKYKKEGQIETSNNPEEDRVLHLMEKYDHLRNLKHNHTDSGKGKIIRTKFNKKNDEILLALSDMAQVFLHLKRSIIQQSSDPDKKYGFREWDTMLRLTGKSELADDDLFWLSEDSPFCFPHNEPQYFAIEFLKY
ncbi:unnamed protein product [[Candida] boidinii]|nr:unnamed protein product [[Candida] boidinii]